MEYLYSVILLCNVVLLQMLILLIATLEVS